jgi:hypothetical protein
MAARGEGYVRRADGGPGGWRAAGATSTRHEGSRPEGPRPEGSRSEGSRLEGLELCRVV